MSHSRQTEHYGLPLYNGTDIINPLTDFNDANDAIDTALYNANQSASNANTKADSAVEAVAGYDERITKAETKADNALTKNSDTEKMIANQFDPLKDDGYEIGDSVIYNDKLYTFINPHTGAWDAGDVKQSTITEAVKDTISEGEEAIRQEVQDALDVIAGQTEKVTATQKMIAPPFDANKQDGYVATDVVTYADKLYQFDSDHVGAWTGTDVHQVDMIDMLDETVTGVKAIVGNLENKIINKVVLSEEQFYENTAVATFKQKINDVCGHIVDLFNNKADDVIDIIVDGIDYGGATFVCEWSAYDMTTKSALTATYVGIRSGYVGYHTISYGYDADYTNYVENTLIIPSTTGAVTGNSVLHNDEASDAKVRIAYHYLYKIEE